MNHYSCDDSSAEPTIEGTRNPFQRGCLSEQLFRPKASLAMTMAVLVSFGLAAEAASPSAGQSVVEVRPERT